MRRLLLALGGLAALSAAVLAADHGDSPAIAADPATDINDLYSWVNTDDGRLVMVATVFPAATAQAAFATDALYVFHVVSQDDLLAPTGAPTTHEVVARFDATGSIDVWVDGNYAVSGDASDPAGLSGGGVKVFAGPRDDPFFFNGEGLSEVADAVNAAAGSLTFDAFGCPALDEGTATALVTQLGTGATGAAAEDSFAGANVLALVIEIDLSMVNDGGDILGVWASTNQIGS